MERLEDLELEAEAYYDDEEERLKALEAWSKWWLSKK